MAVKALIVDDTVTYRKILSDILSAMPDIEIIGTAPNGVIALRKIALQPVDIVLLDLFMPEMDGIETLKHIRKDHPKTKVVMVSSGNPSDVKDTVSALELGAVDFIRKPSQTDPQANLIFLKNEISRVLHIFPLRNDKKILPVTVSQPVKPAPPFLKTLPPVHVDVLAVGISTGGPEALHKFIPFLPESLSVPVLLVQHMPPVFTNSLAESLARKSKVKVVEAKEGEPVVKGTVYIAPGGRHMTVMTKDLKNVIALNDGPPENSCRPSVDVLFRSVASVYKQGSVLSLIMTGMGSDGLNGVRALKRKNCFSITQSESTCVVYGMPRAVDEAGLSDLSVPLPELAEQVSKLIH